MGYDQNSPLIASEVCLQPADRSDIQMVGRLIEDDQIRALQQQLGKRNSCFLSA